MLNNYLIVWQPCLVHVVWRHRLNSFIENQLPQCETPKNIGGHWPKCVQCGFMIFPATNILGRVTLLLIFLQFYLIDMFCYCFCLFPTGGFQLLSFLSVVFL